jgi:micrococcal nuclease
MIVRTLQVSFILAALLLAPCTASAAPNMLQGRVVRIVDGDTLVVLDASKVQHKIRLSGIDAPESGQGWGTRAKQHLSSLAGGKDVDVEIKTQDKYGRTVGKIIADDQDVNLAMVRAGMAWWYRKYAKDQSAQDRVLYATAESTARKARTGLWADPNPVPPEDYRRGGQPTMLPSSTGNECPCAIGVELCTGPKGGKYCFAPDGKKRYSHQN